MESAPPIPRTVGRRIRKKALALSGRRPWAAFLGRTRLKCPLPTTGGGMTPAVAGLMVTYMGAILTHDEGGNCPSPGALARTCRSGDLRLLDSRCVSSAARNPTNAGHRGAADLSSKRRRGPGGSPGVLRY